MKYYLLLVLALGLSTHIKAQQTPRDEYTEFARFGKYDSYVDYIAEHVKKPENITSDAKGIIAITVLIDSTGRASVFKISQKISPEVDAEFTKAVLAAPQWAPATFHGKPVQVYFTIKIGVEVNKAAATMTTDAGVDKVYNAVQVQPSFPGGTKAFDDFIHKTMVYPTAARKNNVQGRVFLSFTVETDGSLTDFRVLRDPGSGLGEEAMRIMKLSPKWTPGMQKGKLVRVQFTVPINFSLY